jgi:hypothetical protein
MPPATVNPEMSPEPRSIAPLVLGASGVVCFVVGAALVRTRDWACRYRYWSDGGSSSKPAVAAVLLVGGILLGIGAAGWGIRRYQRSRRGVDLVAVFLGLLPVLLGVVLALLVSQHRWAYDCSTG